MIIGQTITYIESATSEFFERTDKQVQKRKMVLHLPFCICERGEITFRIAPSIKD